MDLKGFVSAVRIENCVISIFGVLVGFILSSGYFEFSNKLLLLLVSVFAITGAGNAINDFFDADIDKRLGRKKQEGKTSYWLSLSLFTIGIFLSAFVNFHAIIIASVSSLALIIYAGLLQKFKYVGNWLIAILTAFTIFYGATLNGSYGLVFFPALSAFFANGAREIIKDLEDLKGDKGYKITLPMLVGIEKIKKIVFFIFLFSIVCAFLAFYNMKNQIIYLSGFLVTVSLLYFSYQDLLKNNFSNSRKLVKFAMVSALLSFILGSLIVL
ncbi:MAG: UbiA family prenyltransferase [Candidatus Diapherotrites archaeon]